MALFLCICHVNPRARSVGTVPTHPPTTDDRRVRIGVGIKTIAKNIFIEHIQQFKPLIVFWFNLDYWGACEKHSCRFDRNKKLNCFNSFNFWKCECEWAWVFIFLFDRDQFHIFLNPFLLLSCFEHGSINCAHIFGCTRVWRSRKHTKRKSPSPIIFDPRYLQYKILIFTSTLVLAIGHFWLHFEHICIVYNQIHDILQ